MTTLLHTIEQDIDDQTELLQQKENEKYLKAEKKRKNPPSSIDDFLSGKVQKPTIRKSFVGKVTKGIKTVEQAAEFGFELLKNTIGVEDIRPHYHIDEHDNETKCTNLACEFWFWKHPEVMDVFKDYEELEPYVNKDPRKFNSVLLLKIRKDQKLLLGKVVKTPAGRIRIVSVLKIVALVLSSATVGTFLPIVFSILSEI